MNPSDGSMLQTIEIPNFYGIHGKCLLNDQIVVVQRAEKGSDRRLLSYYNLKRVHICIRNLSNSPN